MYKNGQIITVNGKKYRVKTATSIFSTCEQCDLQFSKTEPCESLCLSKESKLNIRQCLEQIPIKNLCGKTDNV